MYHQTQTDEQFIITSLPQLPQLNIPVQFPPMMAPVATAFITALITDIQNGRGNSIFRSMYHSRMSQNWYQNQDFGRVAQFAVDLAEALMGKGNDINSASAAAIRDAIQVTLAVGSLQDPRLLAIMDQQTMADFQNLNNHGQQLKGMIQNFKMMSIPGQAMTGGMVPGVSYGGGGMALPAGLSGPMTVDTYNGLPGTTGGTGRPSTLGNVGNSVNANPGLNWNPTTSSVSTSVGAGGATVRAPGRYDMTGIDDPGNNTGSNDRAMTMIVNAPPGNVGTSTAAQLGTAKATPAAPATGGGFSWGVAPSTPSTPAVVPASTPVAPSPEPSLTRQYEPVADMVTTPNDLVSIGLEMRPFDLIETPDGAQITPAGLKHAEFTGTKDQPYPMAYDPAKYLLVYVKTPDGIVTESLVDWKENMDYLDNEINGKLAAKERQRRLLESGKKSVSGWSLAQALNPNASNTISSVNEEAVMGLPPNSDLVDMEITPYLAEPSEVVVIDSISAGLKKVESGLKLAGASELQRKSYEAYLSIPQLFVFPDESWAEKAKALAEADSLDDLHKRLSEFTELDDADLLISLDARITNVVNATLKEGMSLVKWSVDSFINDWNDLKAELVGQYGSEEMLDILNEYSTNIIDATFSCLDAANTTAYLTELGYFDPVQALEQEAQSELIDLANEIDADEATEAVEQQNQGQETEGDLPGTETEETATEVDGEGSETEEEDAEFTFTNVVVFVDRVSVTTIPETREEISLRLDTGCLIVQEYQPALHAAVSAILVRTPEVKMVYKHRYIRTSDHKFLEVKRGLLNDTALLIFDRGELY